MGEEGASDTPEEWIVHYRGGGPLDGQVSVTSSPLSSHSVAVHDGPFEGFQVYEREAIDHQERVMVLAYQGERWGPALTA